MAKRWLNPTIIVPWNSYDGVRQRSVFNFKGDVDDRRVRRMIRRAFQKGMHVRVPTFYLKHYIGKAGWTEEESQRRTSSKSGQLYLPDKKTPVANLDVPYVVQS